LDKNKMSRRDFLLYSTVTLSGLALAACQPAPTREATNAATPTEPTEAVAEEVETEAPQEQPNTGGQAVEMAGYPSLEQCASLIQAAREQKDPQQSALERYRDLVMFDIHNHDSDGLVTLSKYDRNGIDRVVLFGAISEPAALASDSAAFAFYRQHPDRFYPNFCGVPLHDEDMTPTFPEGTAVLDPTRANLEKGYFGIGEIVGSSTRSPMASRLAWKAEHPNEGYLPGVYALAAEYRVPILLHIDPPTGMPIVKLEEALEQNPDTMIIFAHANAYNPPENIAPLLRDHPNLYFDFFAGFTAYNPGSQNKLVDFVDVMETYPDRCFLSTDSGYDVGFDRAALAMYEMVDLLTPETACKVSYLNYLQIIEAQPPTETQLERVTELLDQLSEHHATDDLNKRQVHELIFELENRITDTTGGS
jgi:hypothetical protein